jgi:hypothetical protein
MSDANDLCEREEMEGRACREIEEDESHVDDELGAGFISPDDMLYVNIFDECRRRGRISSQVDSRVGFTREVILVILSTAGVCIFYFGKIDEGLLFKF